MTNSNHSTRRALRGSAAFSAIALLGAGLVAAVAIPTAAVAQDYTNVTAAGRVQGTNGQPISGATVVITSNDQGFTRTVTTDSSGGFRVPQLPTGSYTFTVSAPGFQTFSDPNVELTQDSASNQFTLASETAAADDDLIVVTAGRVSTPDFESNTTGAVIEIGDIATRVPVQRTLRDVILLAPGTTQGGSTGNARFDDQAQIGGSSFSENAYYINGLNVTEFREGFSPVDVPFDFYETVEVKTGGFQAEFGRATGGVVNAITKSGSNEFHGSVLFNWEPDDLRSDQPNSYEDDNDFDQVERTDMVATLSGPIIEDRLFFFALYNAKETSTIFGTADARDPDTEELTPERNTVSETYGDSPFYAFKIDAVPLDGQRLELTYFDSTGSTTTRSFNYNSATNEIGQASGSFSTLTGGENYVGRYTGTFTDWLTVSAAYGVNENRRTILPASIDTPRVVDARSGQGFPLPGTNPNASFTTNDDRREFYRGDVDLFFNLFGSHHIRFGYDHEELESVQLATPTGGGFYTISTSTGPDDISNLPEGTEYFSRRFFQNGGEFRSINEAFYIQDNWTLLDDRLTLQLGLRNDRFENQTADGTPFYQSGDQWGPRVGASFDLFGDQRTKIYGSFGRYFLPIPTNTNIRLAGAELDYREFFLFGGLDANGVPIAGAPVNGVDNARPCPNGSGTNCTITGDGTASDPTSVVSRNLEPQSLDEYIVGAEHRLNDDWKVGLSYTHRSLNASLEDAAIDLAVRDFCVANGIPETPILDPDDPNDPGLTGGCEDIWIGFHQYVLLNPGSDATVLLDTPLPGETELRTVSLSAEDLRLPAAKRTYDAVTFEVEREFDGIWSLKGSYTWSELKGNIEGGVKSDIGQDDSGLTQDFDTPGLTVGSYGFLPGHRRHTLKLFGSYAVNDWFTVGGTAFVQSPKKFGCIGVVPGSVDPVANLYGAAGNFCGGELVPRGTAFESDWNKELNLSFLVRAPTDAFDASIRFDIFNVFNSKSALDFDEFGEANNGTVNPNYMDPLIFQAPRSARIQLRVGF